jgi:hypothetical protein
MVYNSRIAFHDAIHGQIASVPCVGDLPVFERLDGSLDGI